MKKPLQLLVISFLFVTPSFAQYENEVSRLPVLPTNLHISYPDSNPLKQALKPLPESAIFKMVDYYLWDPSVIKVEDTYHLFCSRWPAENGMQGWKQSHVIRATSKSLFGPYKFQEVVLHPSNQPWATQAVHNPKIVNLGNQYLLYYLGIPKWKTGFAFADSIQGPWISVSHPVINTNNPAVLIKGDGSVYAVGKYKPKPIKDGRWDAYMNAFKASSIKGPFELVKDALNRLPNDFELEDPTIWWANNQYNVVCTDWEAKVTGIEKAVIYYTSKNGIDYELYSQIPVWSQKEPIPLDSGKDLFINGVERPQVYVNEQGKLVALLASIYPLDDIPTYVVIRPVNNFVPEN